MVSAVWVLWAGGRKNGQMGGWGDGGVMEECLGVTAASVAC